MGWLIGWSVLLAVAALGTLVSANSLRLRHRVAREMNALAAVPHSDAPSVLATLQSLPAPVARYLELALTTERRIVPVQTARIRHHGTMRGSPDARWMDVRGVQLFTTDPPGFVWWGRARMAPGIWVDARDMLVDGHGGMRIVLESTLVLQDSPSPELDQGASMRVLVEMMWFPVAFLDTRYVQWDAIDERNARATLTLHGREVAAVLHFGDDGMIASFLGQRYRDVDGKARLTPWFGNVRDYRLVSGMRVPFDIDVGWTLAGDSFTVIRFQVDSLEYDVGPGL